jgi:hypothetical protein
MSICFRAIRLTISPRAAPAVVGTKEEGRPAWRTGPRNPSRKGALLGRYLLHFDENGVVTDEPSAKKN